MCKIFNTYGFGISTHIQWVSRPPIQSRPTWILLLTSCTQTLHSWNQLNVDSFWLSDLLQTLWQLIQGLHKHCHNQHNWLKVSTGSVHSRHSWKLVCVCPTSSDLVGILRRCNWIGQPLGLSFVSSCALTSFSCRNTLTTREQNVQSKKQLLYRDSSLPGHW